MSRAYPRLSSLGANGLGLGQVLDVEIPVALRHEHMRTRLASGVLHQRIPAALGREPAPGVDPAPASVPDLARDRLVTRRLELLGAEPVADLLVRPLRRPAGRHRALERARHGIDVVQDQRRALFVREVDRLPAHGFVSLVLAGDGDDGSNLGHRCSSASRVPTACRRGTVAGAPYSEALRDKSLAARTSSMPSRRAIRARHACGEPYRSMAMASPRAAEARYSSRSAPGVEPAAASRSARTLAAIAAPGVPRAPE